MIRFGYEPVPGIVASSQQADDGAVRRDSVRHVADAVAIPAVADVLARFKDPLTRVLLACDGLTTPLLEAVLEMHLDIRVLRQDVVPATRMPDAVLKSLQLPGAVELLVRRSCLVGRDFVPASVNYVVGSVEAQTATGVGDLNRPIGRTLLAGTHSRRRETLRVGLSEWLDGRPCAAKAYVIFLDDRPVCYIRECYNPDYVSPEALDAEIGGRWDDEPKAAISVGGPLESTSVRSGESALQQPYWPDESAVRACYEQLRQMPPLVSAEQCAALTTELGAAAAGKAFVLHLGDCAETFDLCRTNALNARQALAVAAASTLFYATGRRAVTVGRIAGQYAKPRSQPIDESTGLPSYRGDIVNSAEPLASARVPDPNRMITAYLHAAATVNHLRNQPVPPTHLSADLVGGAARACTDPEMAAMFHNVAGLLAGMAPTPIDSRQLHSWIPQLHVSHEGLLLPYEHALTRIDSEGRNWDCSTQLLWIGERTRRIDSAHIGFAASIANPIAVKIGPTVEVDELVALCRRLNSGRIPGRLTLIPRMGARTARATLPGLMEAIAGTDIPVGWICDPMHGNTRTVGDGRKTRAVEDVVAEIAAFFSACRHTGAIPTGLHLETAPEPVTECTGGWQEITEADLARDYRTQCDPRLNAAQTLQCIGFAVRELTAN